MNTFTVKPDKRFVDIASKMSSIQNLIESIIDVESNVPRMSEYVDDLIRISNSLGNMKSQIGEMMGDLILDEIDSVLRQRSTNRSQISAICIDEKLTSVIPRADIKF